MGVFRKLKLRVLNFFLLEYSAGELWRIVRSRLRSPRPPGEAEKVYSWPDSRALLRHIYVISLPFRTDRREAMQKKMSSLGLPYEIVNGIHGQALDIERLSEDIISPLSKRYLSRGSIGCSLSHIRALEMVAERDHEYALILEDDVVFEKDFAEKMQRLMPQLPSDFDILFLGSYLCGRRHAERFISPGLFIPAYPREGLFAYIVSAKGVRKILGHIFPVNIASGSLDTVVGKIARQKKIKALHVFPPLCRADMSSPSNIENIMFPEKPLDEREKAGGA